MHISKFLTSAAIISVTMTSSPAWAQSEASESLGPWGRFTNAVSTAVYWSPRAISARITKNTLNKWWNAPSDDSPEPGYGGVTSLLELPSKIIDGVRDLNGSFIDAAREEVAEAGDELGVYSKEDYQHYAESDLGQTTKSIAANALTAVQAVAVEAVAAPAMGTSSMASWSGTTLAKNLAYLGAMQAGFSAGLTTAQVYQSPKDFDTNDIAHLYTRIAADQFSSSFMMGGLNTALNGVLGAAGKHLKVPIAALGKYFSADNLDTAGDLSTVTADAHHIIAGTQVDVTGNPDMNTAYKKIQARLVRAGADLAKQYQADRDTATARKSDYERGLAQSKELYQTGRITSEQYAQYSAYLAAKIQELGKVIDELDYNFWYKAEEWYEQTTSLEKYLADGTEPTNPNPSVDAVKEQENYRKDRKKANLIMTIMTLLDLFSGGSTRAMTGV